MPLTKELIQQLREMENRATGGRWFYDGICYLFTEEKDGNNQMIADDHGAEVEETIRMRGVGANLPLDVNAEFLCALRNNATALIEAAEECERLKEEVERLKQTSVKIEKPDGAIGHVKVHCANPYCQSGGGDICLKVL